MTISGKTIGGVILLAIIIVGYFIFIKPNDKDIINGMLQNLSVHLSKKGEESILIQGQKLGEISDMIANPCTVKVKEGMLDGSYSPMEFASKIIRSRKMVKKIFGTLDNVNILISPNKQHALIDFSVTLQGKHMDGKEFLEARDLEATMSKDNKKWKFTSFRVHEVLEK